MAGFRKGQQVAAVKEREGKKPTGQEAALYRAAAAVRSGVQKREASALAYLRSLYGAADKEIGEAADALIAEMEEAEAAGEAITQGWIERSERYRTLLEMIAEKLDTLAPDLAEGVEKAQADAAAAGEADAERMATAALSGGPKGVSLSWNRLPTEALDALAGFMGDGTPLADHFAKIGPDLVQGIRETLFAGLAYGDNPRDVAKRLAAQTQIARARAETIVRTETLRAFREASRLAYAANSDVVTGYVRLSAADSRTCSASSCGVCAACIALHGTEYATDEVMPTHPNCRCVMVPKTKSWADILGEDAEGLDAAAEWDVADLPSGEDLFEKLTEAEQRQILGPGGYGLYKAGAPLAAFAVVENDAQWGPTARVATLAEVVRETGLQEPEGE